MTKLEQKQKELKELFKVNVSQNVWLKIQQLEDEITSLMEQYRNEGMEEMYEREFVEWILDRDVEKYYDDNDKPEYYLYEYNSMDLKGKYHSLDELYLYWQTNVKDKSK
jgi:hypothetical protein